MSLDADFSEKMIQTEWIPEPSFDLIMDLSVCSSPRRRLGRQMVSCFLRACCGLADAGRVLCRFRPPRQPKHPSRASINVTSKWAPIRFSQDNCSFAQGATNSPKPARILASREDRARTPVSIFAVGNEPVVRNETFDATPMAVSLREVEVLKASAHRLL